MALESWWVEPLSLEEPVYADGGDAVYVIDQVRDPDGEDSWISGAQFRQMAGLICAVRAHHGRHCLMGKTQMGGGPGDRHQPGTGEPGWKRRWSSSTR